MRDDRDFRDRLMKELRRYRAFDSFKNDVIADAIREPVELAMQASDSLPVYCASQKFVLEPRDDADTRLRGTIARCEISFISTMHTFDFIRALDVDRHGGGGAVSAAHVEVRICKQPGPELAKWRKTLWSTEPGYIEGEPEYVKLLI